MHRSFIISPGMAGWEAVVWAEMVAVGWEVGETAQAGREAGVRV